MKGAFAMSSIAGRDATGPSRCCDISIEDGRSQVHGPGDSSHEPGGDGTSETTWGSRSKTLIRRVRSAGVKTASVAAIL